MMQPCSFHDIKTNVPKRVYRYVYVQSESKEYEDETTQNYTYFVNLVEYTYCSVTVVALI